MTAGNLCDSCGKFGPAHDPLWWYLIRQPGEPVSPIAAIFDRSEPGTFCSLRCVADWAYVAAMANGTPTGAEPPPRAGTGWPR